MIDAGLIRSNFQLLCIFLMWAIVGAYMGPVYLAFITAFVFLMKLRDLPSDIFIGFLFILILSDNLETYTNFAKTYKTIYMALLFLFFILDLRNAEGYVIGTYKLFIPYFLFGIIGLAYSPVVSTSIQKLLSYILLFITVPNIVANCYRIYGTYFFKTLLYFIMFIVVIGVAMKYVWPEVAISHGGRLRGIFGNPNGLGIFLILSYLLYMILNTRFNLFSRGEKIFFLVFVGYSVIASGSRTALIGILLFHFFSYIFKKSKFLGFLLFGLIMLLTEVFLMYLPQIIIALDLQESFRLETLQEGSGRTVAWAFAWENIKQSILIGKGFAYDEYLMRSNFELLSKAGHQGGVHNTYLIIWLNTGLFGLVSFLWGFFVLFVRASARSSYAFPAMFAIMLSISFEPWLAASLNPFTILFLIVATVMSEDIFYTDDLSPDTENESEEKNMEMA